MKKRITTNLLYLFSGEFASSVLAFVVTIWLARRLTDEGFGRWAFVQSVVIYLSVFVDAGLSTYGMREVARYPEKARHYIANIFSIRLAFALCIILLFAVSLYFIDLTLEMKALFALGSLFLIPQALNPEFAFQGIERMRGVALWRIALHLLYLIPVVLFVHSRQELLLVPFLRFAAGVLAVIILLAILKREVPGSLFDQIKPKLWPGYLKTSMLFAASLVVIKLYYSFDTFMLGILDRPEVVGWYNAAYKIVLLFIAVAGLIQTAFAPSFSRLKEQKEKLDEIVGQFALLLTLLASVFWTSMIMLRADLTRLLFGAQYAPTADVLLLLAISGFFVFIGTVFLAPLLFVGRQKQYFRTVLIGAIINMTLNLLLIPEYSFWGAGIATIISNILIAILGYRYYRRLTNGNKPLKNIGAVVSLLIGSFAFSVFVFESAIVQFFSFNILFLSLFVVFNYKMIIQFIGNLPNR